MLNKIIKFSLDNRLPVLVLAVLLMLAGMYTAGRMEVDVFPDLNAPTVTVMTEAAGMAPEEVERLVTFPVETAVNGAASVRRVRSSSTTGFSVVWVEFDWGTDIYKARQIVSEKLSVIKDALPDNVGSPTMGPQSSILGELMFVSLTSETESLQDLRTIADWTIRPRILATGGVAQVAVLGGEVREYQILLDPYKMKHYGVSLDEVFEAVDGMNDNSTGGILYEYGNEYIIRGLVSTSLASEMALSAVATAEGGSVRLGDISVLQIGNHAPKMGTASHNGKPAVIMTVTKQPGSNTLALSEDIDAALLELRKTLPEGIEVSTDIYRQSRFIESSVDNVKRSLIEGGIFVIIVLFFFLMNVRTTLISLVTIPLSLLFSVLALKLMGITINTMSLGGMCIAIGSLVDDAIVDVENVYKRLRENGSLTEGERRKPLSVIYDASREVRTPILNSTLIIIVSFIPLFFLSGMEGRLLAPLGIAFIVALCSSTLVALTLTPVLCSYLLTSDKASGAVGGQAGDTFFVKKLKVLYESALTWALGHRKPVLAVTGAALAVAVVIFSGLGRSFLPSLNEGSFTINLSTMPGISLEESDKIGRIAEQALLSIPEIKTVGRKTGRAELDEHALGVNCSEIEAPFELDGRSKDDVLADIRTKLAAIPGVNVEVGSPISHRIDAMLSGTRAGIAIKLFGTDLGRMYSIGNQIKDAITDVDGIADLNVEQQVERPQLKILPRREMLSLYGVTIPEFNRMVKVLLSGEKVSEVYEDDRSFDLTLRVDDADRSTIEALKKLPVDAGGGKIPLEALAEVISSSGPNTINRENVSRKVVVSANASGRDMRSVVEDVRSRVEEEISLPDGYRIEYGGQFESEEAASRTLFFTSFLAILVIFLLLYKEFGSMVQASVVLLNLPLALIGGVVAILVSGAVISIPAIIGFISLFGIATRNGMLLVSRYNDLRAGGLSAKDSVIRGSLDRLNPILMTALTSALALIPLALGGDQPGNEIQSPMAVVILGGLFSSTLLNGFIIPIMYLMISKSKSRIYE